MMFKQKFQNNQETGVVDKKGRILVAVLMVLIPLYIFKLLSLQYVDELTAISKPINDYLYTSCDVDSDTIDYITTAVGYLPHDLQSYFTEDGWKIIVVNQIDKDLVNVNGRTVVEDKVIYLKRGMVESTIYHEFGHLYLIKYGLADEFESIWQEEADALMSECYDDDDKVYFVDDEVEYFCEAFNTTFISKCVLGDVSLMLDVSPRTYEFMYNLISNLYE